MTFSLEQSLGTLTSPTAVAALMDPVRMDILRELKAPGSATSVAETLGASRQRIAYHVKALEKAGLIRHVEDVRKGNCIERVMVAKARAFVISPEALGALAPTASEIRDKFSSSYAIALAAEVIEDVATLAVEADAAGKKLPTLSAVTDISFRSMEQQNAFANELAGFLAHLAAKYHADANDRQARTMRLVTTAYPKRHKQTKPQESQP